MEHVYDCAGSGGEDKLESRLVVDGHWLMVVLVGSWLLETEAI